MLMYAYVSLPEGRWDNMTVKWSVTTQLNIVAIAIVSRFGLHQGKWVKTAQSVDFPPLEHVWPCWLGRLRLQVEVPARARSRWRSHWGWLAGAGVSRCLDGGEQVSSGPGTSHGPRGLVTRVSSISWCAMKCKMQASCETAACKAQWKAIPSSLFHTLINRQISKIRHPNMGQDLGQAGQHYDFEKGSTSKDMGQWSTSGRWVGLIQPEDRNQIWASGVPSPVGLPS